MTYKIFNQFICSNGHVWTTDVMIMIDGTNEERINALRCSHCKQKAEYTYFSDKEENGPLKEIGFDDIPQVDHHGNKYFTKLMKYEIDNSTNRWEKI